MTAEQPPRTILLVEDDRDVRAALQAVLLDEGFQVLAAPNGYDALASIEHHRLDVIILDWMMPVVDGSRFVQALRAEYRITTPVLVITAGRVSRDEAIAAGADDYLQKPFDINDLLARIHSLAGKGGTAAGAPKPKRTHER
jgi:two-component system OmpR family response regulator